MKCDYFGICGSCTLGGKSYEEQLNIKVSKQIDRFKNLYNKDIAIIKSGDGAFRDRAEFRIWKIFDTDISENYKLHYAMNDIDKKILTIQNCSIVNSNISNLMPILLEELDSDKDLSFKLFTIEFLSSTIEDMLVTLIYHRKLDENWSLKAKELEKKLNIKIIGRSRKQKIVISDDTINEELKIKNSTFKIKYKEGGFTQPNQNVNIKMIEWVLDNIDEQNKENDLCELYCGGGNFTIPLSKRFNKVLATEISKTSIKSARINCELNDITNIDFIRMSSEEFVEARDKVRDFTRLKDIDLDSYNFSTIFLDPPRAGLDETTTKLSTQFNEIVYISCNPETLHRDLEILTKTHTIKHFALFDQFAYSNHIESGVILVRDNI
ncbi:MAG: tRNA (uridine(54)-C5)-methyltransferase TrmA [Campylobacterota bacterium]|nr:tRNA (uridine(54)-C5)-methyltransferase TrmA [Campylobacterota bacterium]